MGWGGARSQEGIPPEPATRKPAKLCCRRQCHPHHGGFDTLSVTNRTSVRLNQETEALQTTTSHQNGQAGNKTSAHYTSEPGDQRKSTVGGTHASHGGGHDTPDAGGDHRPAVCPHGVRLT